jgi:hypothetical protein
VSLCQNAPSTTQVISSTETDPATGLPGEHVVLNIGQVSPRDAAAIWWDLPAQSEIFPGATVTFLAGSEGEYGFVASILFPTPSGPIPETARFTAQRSGLLDYSIGENIFEPTPVGTGFGTFAFVACPHETLMVVDNYFNTQAAFLPTLEAEAVGAAQAHQARYLAGRQATAEEKAYLASALGGACH